MVDDSLPSDNSHDFDGVACRPPRGKTFLTIGQDFFSIEEYILSQYNASLHREDGHHIRDEVGNSPRPTSTIFPLDYFHPAAAMVYTDIYQLKGLDQPTDYGSGIEYVKGLADAFPKSGLQIGLWLNGYQGCRDIVSGVLDDKIHRLFDFIQSDLPETLPKVFLRVGYEFDNPWFGYSDDPLAYQEAFRTVVRACERQMTSKVCRDKVDFVWHSWAAPRKDYLSLEEFYPGNYFVDWVGISIFQQVYPWANDKNQNAEGNFAGGSMRDVREVLDFAKRRKKSIMIGESTPFGGMNVAESEAAKEYVVNDKDTNTIWNMWFQKTIDIIEEYDISMWSYINCDWDSQPMWNGVGFGDTRLSSSEVVMSQWWEEVLSKNSRFLGRIEDCSPRQHHSRDHAKEEPRLASEQQMTTTIEGVTAIADFGNYDLGLEYFSLNTRSLYLLNAAGAIVFTIAALTLSLMRNTKNRKDKHRGEKLSQGIHDPDSNYGSLD
eukprot:jgi/Psemu1/185784/e_gw1.52.2.1